MRLSLQESTIYKAFEYNEPFQEDHITQKIGARQGLKRPFFLLCSTGFRCRDRLSETAKIAKIGL